MSKIQAKIIKYQGQTGSTPYKWLIELDGRKDELSSWEEREEIKEGLTYELNVTIKEWGGVPQYMLVKDSKITIVGKPSVPRRTATTEKGPDITEAIDLVDEEELQKLEKKFIDRKKSKKEVKIPEPSDDDIEAAIETEKENGLVEFKTDQSIALSVDRQAMIEQFQDYQYLMANIVDKSDWVAIKGKQVLKKSGFIKIATFFNVSVSIPKSDIEDLSVNKNYKYRMRAKAIMPNGRYMEAVGMCSSEEYEDQKFARSEHVIYGTAETRASLRAISKLMGMGLVSEDEMR